MGFYIVIFFGAIAQLAERLHGMQDVSGSNPLSSIMTSKFSMQFKYNNEISR